MPSGCAPTLLSDYLTAPTDVESDAVLARILTDCARPLIRRIVASNVRDANALGDADDLVSDALTHLLRQLRALKCSPSRRPIGDLHGYVAAVAYHSCNDWLRQRYPGRHRLRNHLRYFLSQHRDYSMWRAANGRLVCGIRASRDEAYARRASARRGGAADRVAEVVRSILDEAHAPVDFEALVTIVGEKTGLHDPPQMWLPAEETPAHSTVASAELRVTLQQLWREIRSLAPKQRAALLLNLRDENGRDLTTLLPLTRTATIAEIADAVQVPLHEFADLWNRLPLDDNTIAAILGATRPQVIKLRRLARERLRRRQSPRKRKMQK